MGGSPAIPRLRRGAPAASGVEAVADAADGDQVARALRILLELGAELLDEVVDGARRAVVVRAPDAGEDGVAAERRAARLDEADQDVELRRRHLDRSAGAGDGAGGGVDLPVAEL